MKVSIFHANEAQISRDHFSGEVMNVRVGIAKRDFVFAGAVEVGSLGGAYHASQNLEESWGDGAQRSTSVGDVLVAHDDQVGDLAYVVARLGFTPVGFDSVLVPRLMQEVAQG